MEFVRYERHSPHVALVTLNRPERLNAFGRQMRVDFEEALVEAARDDAIRAVIVAGAGRAFCAGADIKEWASGVDPTVRTDETPRTLNEWGTHDFIKPMVAAVHGYCLGAGLNLVATRCDIRVATEGALFGMPEVERGIIDLTTPFALEGLPRSFLSELLYTGDPVSAQRAYEVGLVNAVVPDDQLMATAERYAERIVRHSPMAVRATKMNLLQTFAATPSANAWEQRLRERVSGSSGAREGMQAFAERRTPEWEQGGR